MSDQSSKLKVHVDISNEDVVAMEWVPVTIHFRSEASKPLALMNLDVVQPDSQIRLQTDLFERDVLIRPGEQYTVAARLQFLTSGRFNLSSLYYELFGENRVIHFDDSPLDVRPSLGEEIEITCDPICSYEDDTKVRFQFEHKGQTIFRRLIILISPIQQVQAGKSILRLEPFQPGDTEILSHILAPGEITVQLIALYDQATEVRASKTFPIQPFEDKRNEPFAFLEPRRLSSCEVLMFTKERERAIKKTHSTFQLVSGRQYHVLVKPEKPYCKDQKVEMQHIPGSAYVRPFGYQQDDEGWLFEIEITEGSRFSKSERIHYTVIDQHEEQFGEIHVILTPPWWRHLTLALAIGVAATFHGVSALTRRLSDGDLTTGEIFEDFDLQQGIELISLLLIPIAWTFLAGFDRLIRMFLRS